MGKTSWGVLGLLFACWVQGAPTLTVVTDVWPPFRMLAQNDEFHGLDIDILHQLQARSGIALTLKRVPWGRALKQMQTGQADLMIGLAHTPERAAFIDYLQPAYYQCRPAFYGKAAAVATLKTYEDLRGREIGYVLNSAYFAPFDDDGQLDAGLIKADYRPPHPVVLYLGMSKHSPHHDLGPALAQALQTMVESGEIEALAKPYQP